MDGRSESQGDGSKDVFSQSQDSLSRAEHKKGEVMSEDNGPRNGTHSPEAEDMEEVRVHELPPIITEPYVIERGQVRFFVYGAMLFFFLTFCCLIATIWILVRSAVEPPNLDSTGRTASEILSIYVTLYLSPIMLVVVAFACSGVGLLLMRSVGAAQRRVIPPEDKDVLKELMVDDPSEGRRYYIELSSLTGWVGIFTKMNITGLPLATILLTLVFAVLSLPIWYGPGGDTQNIFPDLAKLTLGAFLGSYVQRQAGDGATLPSIGSAKR